MSAEFSGPIVFDKFMQPFQVSCRAYTSIVVFYFSPTDTPAVPYWTKIQ